MAHARSTLGEFVWVWKLCSGATAAAKCAGHFKDTWAASMLLSLSLPPFSYTLQRNGTCHSPWPGARGCTALLAATSIRQHVVPCTATRLVLLSKPCPLRVPQSRATCGPGQLSWHLCPVLLQLNLMFQLCTTFGIFSSGLINYGEESQTEHAVMRSNMSLSASGASRRRPKPGQDVPLQLVADSSCLRPPLKSGNRPATRRHVPRVLGLAPVSGTGGHPCHCPHSGRSAAARLARQPGGARAASRGSESAGAREGHRRC